MVTPDETEHDHGRHDEPDMLPEAERSLSSELGELGYQMTRRRMQLLGPHAGEVAVTTARSFPVASVMLAAGAFTLGAALLGRPGRNRLGRFEGAG